MLQWLSAILVLLIVGVVSTWLAHGPLRRRDETATGIATLSALSWREFIGIVLEALAKRGYRRQADHGTPSGDADVTLIRNGDPWLLSAKHGSAFVLGRPSVNELSSAMALAGASGGLLVTQGLIDDDARRAAHGRRIELLDGATLWPWLRPLLPASVMAPIAATATRHARERTLAGWVLALVLGAAVYAFGGLALSGSAPASDEAPPVAEAPAASAPAPAAAKADAVQTDSPATGPIDAPAPQALPTAPPAGTPEANPDAATLEAQRRELANAIATLDMVSRTAWSSASTLQVFLADLHEDPFGMICPLVERYPALAASRIQLTPPEGSDGRVRFRQCRSY